MESLDADKILVAAQIMAVSVETLCGLVAQLESDVESAASQTPTTVEEGVFVKMATNLHTEVAHLMARL